MCGVTRAVEEELWAGFDKVLIPAPPHHRRARSDLIGRLDAGSSSSSSLGAPERQPDISDGDSAQVLSAHDNYNNVDDRQSVWLPGRLAD